KLEDTGHKQAGWRVDPARAGAGGCLGDIGTHAYQLADFVTGLHARELAADLGRFVEGRRLDDNAHILLRYDSGARGMLWASQVAPGNENGLRLRVYGDKAGLEWSQEHPNQLRFSLVGRPPQTLSRGGPCLGAAAGEAVKVRHVSDRASTTALAGPAVVNSGERSTACTTSERVIGRNPNLGKNPAAVSVRR